VSTACSGSTGLWAQEDGREGVALADHLNRLGPEGWEVAGILDVLVYMAAPWIVASSCSWSGRRDARDPR